MFLQQFCFKTATKKIPLRTLLIEARSPHWGILSSKVQLYTLYKVPVRLNVYLLHMVMVSLQVYKVNNLSLGNRGRWTGRRSARQRWRRSYRWPTHGRWWSRRGWEIGRPTLRSWRERRQGAGWHRTRGDRLTAVGRCSREILAVCRCWPATAVVTSWKLRTFFKSRKHKIGNKLI